MAIAILFVTFISLFLLLGLISSSENCIRDIIIKNSLIFFVILLIITELSSTFKHLNFNFIFLSWLLILLLIWLAIFLIRHKSKLFLNHIWLSLQAFLNSIKGKVAFYILITLLLLVFIQGIINPPNNWDSMTYHLARIVTWIGQQSLDHFPTHITRQVYQPPFAEFIILHVNELSGSDYFANLVQFFFLLLSLPVLLSLLDEIGIKNCPTWLVAMLLFTIPNVVLQASSTQNDIVVSFFILSATGFAIKSFREDNITDYFYFGISVGLAMLTKGTAYIYLAPIILMFGFAIILKIFKSHKFSSISYAIMAALIAIALNTGQFYRNQQLSGNILGISERENNRYINQTMDTEVLVSNFIKNASLHLGPYPLSRISKAGVMRLHEYLGLNADDPGTNWLGGPFLGASDFPSHEDTAANPFHFLLIFISIVFIVILWLRRRVKMNWEIFILLLIVIAQMLLFSGYLRWQPWHSRLHAAGFMLCIPLIIYTCQISTLFARLVKTVVPVILGYAFLVILFNSSRPYMSVPPFTRDISVLDSRDRKFYANKPFLFDEYEAIKGEITQRDFKNVGLILDREDWEYPLFRDVYTRPLRPVHVMVTNITNAAPVSFLPVDCIVATNMNAEFIDYKGKHYVNQSSGNKYAWFYCVE